MQKNPSSLSECIFLLRQPNVLGDAVIYGSGYNNLQLLTDRILTRFSDILNIPDTQDIQVQPRIIKVTYPEIAIKMIDQLGKKFDRFPIDKVRILYLSPTDDERFLKAVSSYDRAYVTLYQGGLLHLLKSDLEFTPTNFHPTPIKVEVNILHLLFRDETPKIENPNIENPKIENSINGVDHFKLFADYMRSTYTCNISNIGNLYSLYRKWCSEISHIEPVNVNIFIEKMTPHGLYRSSSRNYTFRYRCPTAN